MQAQCRETGLIDLAIFYGRDNYLLGPDGHMPGNLFATITEGLTELAAACQDLWRNGAGDERMTFSRLAGMSSLLRGRRAAFSVIVLLLGHAMPRSERLAIGQRHQPANHLTAPAHMR